MIVLLSDLRRCRSTNLKLRPLKPTQFLYEEYFGIEGKLYGFKVAMLQLLTVMLQAFGKLQTMGGLVSFAFYSAPKHSDAFERCFWTFVGFLCLNSIYPTVLLAVPSVKWVAPGCCDDGCGFGYCLHYHIPRHHLAGDLRTTAGPSHFRKFRGCGFGQLPSRIGPRICIPSRLFWFLCCLLFSCTRLHYLPCLRAKRSIDLLEEVAKLTELCFPVTAEPIEIFFFPEMQDSLQSIAFCLHWFPFRLCQHFQNMVIS